MTPARLGIAFTLVFALAWAVVEALGGALVGYSPYQVVFTRYVVHLSLMLVVWGWREPKSLWRTRRPFFQVSRSMLMVVMPASFVLAIEHGVDPRALLGVFWLSPILVLVLSAIFLRERARLDVWVATLVAGITPQLLLAGGPSPAARTIVYPLAMALSFSAYVVMTRSLRSETTRANLFYTALGVVVALAPFVRGVWVTPAPRDLAVMAAVGVLGFGVLYALDRAAEVAPLGASMPLVYLQLPIFVGLQSATGQAHAGKRVLAATALLAGVGVYLWVREGGRSPRPVQQAPGLPSPP